ncbi:hypothetical protein FHE72_23630 (plasmid) [Rossellomorea vietnamensis]|uniref:Uncharacterized protein n=1 Tax=Rossellomorea vietnamensis TaxID=218284 RepID=A0A6I6ULU3_9BACI|nr:hypothetical protein [Rossellomorea vietnamensis]QHE63985.1 hypothetical protein FHE72_23630 [Rossellomorea vietnamensis]
MNALMKLKEIAESQKSITTSRLSPLLKEIEAMYIQQGKRIINQRNELSFLQVQFNRQKQFKEKKSRRVD